MTARSVGRWLYRRGENLLALMVGVMFVAFLLQVGFRYWLAWPTGWSNELTVVLWIWIVLFGAAFVVREEEEIRFEILFAAAGRRVRKAMFLVFALALVVIYAVSLPAVWDYVSFMRVERTSYLHIRFDWLYSIYVLFVLATLARYVWLIARVVTGRESLEAEADPTKAASGI
jgi:TRAP-type C4-dicarboxylate transport system permease small subunit